MILATAVINGAFNDLAKFIPPPMTPEEAVLDKAMKGRRRRQRRAAQRHRRLERELVKTNTAILAKAFADTETFWKARGKDDAVKIRANRTRRPRRRSRWPPAQGNWNEAKTHSTTLGQQCQAVT